MTDIEQKALVLINQERAKTGNHPIPWPQVHFGATAKALCRTIEQHEAFRQEVSDVVEQALSFGDVESLRRKGVLSRFIIPKPKPDPLVEALHEVDTGPEWDSAEDYCNKVRAALDALGFEIREKGQ